MVFACLCVCKFISSPISSDWSFVQVMYLSTQFIISSLTLFHIEVHPSHKIMHVYEVTLFVEIPLCKKVYYFSNRHFIPFQYIPNKQLNHVIKVSSTGYRVLLNKIWLLLPCHILNFIVSVVYKSAQCFQKMWPSCFCRWEWAKPCRITQLTYHSRQVFLAFFKVRWWSS